jgi:hypothetical protein
MKFYLLTSEQTEEFLMAIIRTPNFMNFLTRMRSRYPPFPHSFRIVIRPHLRFCWRRGVPIVTKFLEALLTVRTQYKTTHLQLPTFTGKGGCGEYFWNFDIKFWNLSKQITLSPAKANVIVLACCYLHNFLKNSSVGYATSGVFHMQQITSDTLKSDTWGEANNDFA